MLRIVFLGLIVAIVFSQVAFAAIEFPLAPRILQASIGHVTFAVMASLMMGKNATVPMTNVVCLVASRFARRPRLASCPVANATPRPDSAASKLLEKEVRYLFSQYLRRNLRLIFAFQTFAGLGAASRPAWKAIASPLTMPPSSLALPSVVVR